MEKILVNGVELAYDRSGSGDQLIIFLHGVGADRTAWKPQMEFFANEGYICVAVDMRGTGDSQARFETGEVVPISIALFARDTHALIQALGWTRAHWVGNSMGGVIIQHALSERYPTVDRAAICNSFAFHPQSREILPRAANALRLKSLEAFAGERIPQVLKPGTDAGVLKEAIQAMARKDPEAYLASWRATWSPDYRSALPSFTVPCLIVSSDLDQATPTALSEELARNIPGARHVMIPGAGHISNLDNPQLFNKALLEFLRSP